MKSSTEINLNVEDKEFLVLVGPSGCGKSTLLRMIAGLEEISEGTISMGDKVINDVAPKDRGLAMVFQNYALYPHMNVYENMAFGLKQRKTPKPDIIAQGPRSGGNSWPFRKSPAKKTTRAFRRTASARGHGQGHGKKARCFSL